MKTIRILALAFSFGAASLVAVPAAHACDGHCGACAKEKKDCGQKECACAHCAGKEAKTDDKAKTQEKKK